MPAAAKRGRPPGTTKEKPGTPLRKALRNLAVATYRGSTSKEHWAKEVGKLTACALTGDDPHAESKAIFADLRIQSQLSRPPAKEPKEKTVFAHLATNAGGMVLCPACGEYIIISAAKAAGKSAHVTVKL